MDLPTLELAPTRKWPWIVGILGIVAGCGAIVIGVWFAVKEPEKPKSPVAILVERYNSIQDDMSIDEVDQVMPDYRFVTQQRGLDSNFRGQPLKGHSSSQRIYYLVDGSCEHEQVVIFFDGYKVVGKEWIPAANW